MFSDVCSTGSWFCTQEKFGINLVLVQFSGVSQSAIPQRAANFCFLKKWFLSIIDFVHWGINKKVLNDLDKKKRIILDQFDCEVGKIHVYFKRLEK